MRPAPQVFQRSVNPVEDGEGGGVAGGDGGVVGAPVADLHPGQLGQDQDVGSLPRGGQVAA